MEQPAAQNAWRDQAPPRRSNPQFESLFNLYNGERKLDYVGFTSLLKSLVSPRGFTGNAHGVSIDRSYWLFRQSHLIFSGKRTEAVGAEKQALQASERREETRGLARAIHAPSLHSQRHARAGRWGSATPFGGHPA
ncbi:MAG: hypothetical protein ACLQF1_02050 [Methyloceanibacter sp.]